MLEEAGLTGVLADARFLRESLARATERLERRVRLATSLDTSQLETWIAAFTGRDGAVRFGDLRPAIAEALLRPWVNEAPSSEVREWIKVFLLRTLGDPRVRRGEWAPVSPGSQSVLRRWLVKETLDLFFELIDATARDDHWQARKEFWTGYLAKDLIDDAWLILGTQARALGRAEIGRVGSTWALLRGAASDQSALLLRIGGATVLEWSHSGAIRCWVAGDGRAPQLYRPRYSGGTLRADCDWRTRHSRGWEVEVRNWIGRETGVLR